MALRSLVLAILVPIFVSNAADPPFAPGAHLQPPACVAPVGALGQPPPHLNRKLVEKLRRGAIDALELRTLLGQDGWQIRNTTGSHEQWVKGSLHLTLATHSKDLKKYQIKEAREALLGEGF